MSELKPCQNDMCINQSLIVEYNGTECMNDCRLYLSTKPKPAWQINAWEKLKESLIEDQRLFARDNFEIGIYNSILFRMQQIEKKLKELKDG